MIQFNVIPVKHGVVNCQAQGWGKSLMKKCHGEGELNKWKHFASKRIVLEKINGFVKQRTIAYQAMGFYDKTKWDKIHWLTAYLPTLEGKPSAIVFQFVIKHDLKLLALLPHKPNQQTQDILEIIAFCKVQFKYLCD